MQPIGEGNQPASVDDLNQGEFLLTRQKFFPFLIAKQFSLPAHTIFISSFTICAYSRSRFKCGGSLVFSSHTIIIVGFDIHPYGLCPGVLHHLMTLFLGLPAAVGAGW